VKRRKSIKPPEYAAEHPPQQCRKVMSSKVLQILDDLARQQAGKQLNTEARAR
jgi:hypothetical protein